MNNGLIFRLEAQLDLEDVKLYYDRISNKLTTRFFNELFETLDFIKQEPKLYQVRYRSIRIAPLYRFPYGIHYILKQQTVIILRILHTSRYFK